MQEQKSSEHHRLEEAVGVAAPTDRCEAAPVGYSVRDDVVAELQRGGMPAGQAQLLYDMVLFCREPYTALFYRGIPRCPEGAPSLVDCTEKELEQYFAEESGRPGLAGSLGQKLGCFAGYVSRRFRRQPALDVGAVAEYKPEECLFEKAEEIAQERKKIETEKELVHTLKHAPTPETQYEAGKGLIALYAHEGYDRKKAVKKLKKMCLDEMTHPDVRIDSGKAMVDLYVQKGQLKELREAAGCDRLPYIVRRYAGMECITLAEQLPLESRAEYLFRMSLDVGIIPLEVRTCVAEACIHTVDQLSGDMRKEYLLRISHESRFPQKMREKASRTLEEVFRVHDKPIERRRAKERHKAAASIDGVVEPAFEFRKKALKVAGHRFTFAKDVLAYLFSPFIGYLPGEVQTKMIDSEYKLAIAYLASPLADGLILSLAIGSPMGMLVAVPVLTLKVMPLDGKGPNDGISYFGFLPFEVIYRCGKKLAQCL